MICYATKNGGSVKLGQRFCSQTGSMSAIAIYQHFALAVKEVARKGLADAAFGRCIPKLLLDRRNFEYTLPATRSHILLPI